MKRQDDRFSVGTALVAGASLGIALLLVLPQGVATLPIQGDAAGRGLQRSFQTAIAGALLLVQLDLVGLAVGVVTPTRERLPGMISRGLAVGAWLGPPLILFLADRIAAASHQRWWDLCRILEEPLWIVWASGFLLHGLALGRSRTSAVAIALSLIVWPFGIVLPVAWLSVLG